MIIEMNTHFEMMLNVLFQLSSMIYDQFEINEKTGLTVSVEPISVM